MSQANSNNNQSRHTILMFALFLGLLISLFDALVMTLYEVPRAAAFYRVLEPVAVKIIMIFLLYWVLWFLLVYPLGQVLKLQQQALIVSLAVFIGVVYISYPSYSARSWGSMLRNVYTLLFFTGVFLKIVVFSWAAYIVAKVIIQSKWRSFVVAVCLTVPLLLAETVAAMWVNKFLLQPLPDRMALLWKKVFILPVLTTNIVYLIAVIFTLVVFLYFRRSRALVRILQVFAVLVFLASGMVFVLGSDRPLASKANVRTGHTVKRVILIVIDTLRADALSCYGSRQIATPNIDRFAADGIFFEKAFSAAPCTTPSMASILTGLSPFVHMTTVYKSILPDSPMTLAELMYDEGYLTHAIGDNPFLARRNFSQGFVGYNFFPKAQDRSILGKVLLRLFSKRFAVTASTSDLTRLAVEWLNSNKDNDFFLWIHYFDPHSPYTPPAEYLPDRQPPPGMKKTFGSTKGNLPVRNGTLRFNGEQREWIRTLYSCEVPYVDRNVGVLLDHLKKLNLYDDTLIILTSDHGEEFWEHNGFEHGHALYNELLWVPMMIKLPAPSLQTTVPQIVSNGRIVPTVLDLCGIDYKQNYLSYSSLVPAWSTSSEMNDAVPIVCTGVRFYEEKESVIFDGFKYILSLFSGRQELYDLAQDPAETFNIAHLNETEVGNAKQILTENHKEAQRLKQFYFLERPQEREVDSETMRQLKSLGYVE